VRFSCAASGDEFSLFYSLLKKIPLHPTYKQDIFSKKVLFFKETNRTIFVVGYAGTGKTTVISTIVNSLLDINKKYVLLATWFGKSNCQLFEQTGFFDS
jgi:signal recognition particle GTPase